MSVVDYKSAGNAAFLSPSIWADLPTMKMAACPSQFIDIYDDFVKGGVVTDTSVPNWDFVGTNADVEQVVDVSGGQILLEGSGADNDSSFIATPDLYLLGRSTGKKFWFEARVKLSSASGDHSAFVGLMEKVGCTAEAIADNGASVIDEDYVGFFADTNGTSIQPWNITINQGGSSNFPVNILADAVAVSSDFVKFGVKYDGVKTITFFVNGVKTTTYDVTNLDNGTMAHEVAVILGKKDCAASAKGLTIDFVRFVCEK